MTKKAPKSSRPDHDRRSFTVNLSEEEKELIQKACELLGCPMAVFMRMKALDAAKLALRADSEVSNPGVPQ